MVALLRERPSGFTIAELAAALDLKPNAVRKHLVALAQAGQVTARTTPSGFRRSPRDPLSSRGCECRRPRSPCTRARATQGQGRRRTREIERFALLAGHPRALEESLGSLGFAPADVSSASQAAAGYKTIELRACPYLDLVAEPRGELICAFHRGLVQRDAPGGAVLEEFHVAPRGPRCRIVLSGVATLPEGADR